MHAIKPSEVKGVVSRKDFEKTGDIDMEQPRVFWAKTFTQWQKENLVHNMVSSMNTNCRPIVKENMIKLCTRVHPEFGEMIAKGVNMKPI